MAEERFKTTLMGGFDKDDVLSQVKEIRDEAYAEKARLLKELKAKDKVIADMNRMLLGKDQEKEEALRILRKEQEEAIAKLNARLVEKQEQLDEKERAIQTKYKKYIDRYDMIGGLIIEAQEKADNIVAEAEKQRDMLIEEAQREAQRCLDAVQHEVDEKLAEGKRKYIAVQDELNEIVELINQAQRRFMSSYREVHKIISTMPESMKELEDEAEENAAEESTVADCLDVSEASLAAVPEDLDSEDLDEESVEEMDEDAILKLLNEKDDEEEQE